MKWGIIGTGRIANKLASTLVYLKKEGEKFVAVASRDIDKAEAFKEKYDGEKAYGSYDAIYLDRDIDALYIGTPNNLHYSEIKEALLNGKHVLCEKPMTLRPEETIELYNISKEKGKWLLFLLF